MDKMFAIIKVVALFVVIVVVVSSHPMSEENKDVSHHKMAMFPTDIITMKNVMPLLEGIESLQRDDDATTDSSASPAPDAGSTTAPDAGSTTAQPSVTTTEPPKNTTGSGSFPMKSSNSVTTVLLFSVLIIVPGVFFGMC